MLVRDKLLLNFMSLFSVQVLNYMLPLLTLPYLVRVLGPHEYGVIVLAQAVIQYFVLITGYGFNLSVTPLVTMNKHDRDAISSIMSSVIAAKLLLTLVSALILSLLFVSIPSLRIYWFLYLMTFGNVIAELTFPIWLFQGLEDMKYINLGTLISRLLSTMLIFMLIKNPSEYWYVPLFLSGAGIIGGLVSFVAVMHKYGLHFTRVTRISIWEQLVNGWLVFISSLSISLYTTSNPIILGAFTSPTIVGYYSAAEKFINAVLGLLNSGSQTIYPHVVQLIGVSTENGMIFLHKIIKFIAPAMLVMGISISILSHPIIMFLLGSHYGPSVSVLRVLSFLPFLVFLSNVFGIQVMLNLNFKKSFTRIIVIGAVVNITFSFVLVPGFHELGTALSVIASESVVTFGMFWFLLTKGINLLVGRVRLNAL